MNEQMPKQESSNIFGDPLEQIRNMIPETINSFIESLKNAGSVLLESIGIKNLKEGGSKPAQEAFKNGSK
jgi:ABC-type amino acid transport system permease subunit